MSDEFKQDGVTGYLVVLVIALTIALISTYSNCYWGQS
jgi:hypothetical protein